MKIRFFSDIHLEFADFTPPECACDAVVLAGDIGVGMAGARWIEKHFPEIPVFYILGNHEFYDQRFDLLPHTVRNFCDDIGVHFLEKDEYILGNVRFLGCTLWTDFALNRAVIPTMQQLPSVMTDYSVIKTEEHMRALRPSDVLAEHQYARMWLGEKLRTPFAGKTVVITHHAPSRTSLPKAEAGEGGDGIRSAAYASHLDGMMAGVHYWIHGHIHKTSDYTVAGTRVLCNPRGYIPQAANMDFNPYWVIDV